MTDPLAGYRQSINDGKIRRLVWTTEKCPVKVGDRFTLRSCEIEIESVRRRIVKGRPPEWQAAFIRHERERTYLLRQSPPAHADHEEHDDLDAAAIRRAAAESAYTSSPVAAVNHEPESVGPGWEDKGRPDREAKRQEARRERLDVFRQEREIERAAARFTQVHKELGRDGMDLTCELQDHYERLAQLQKGEAA